MSHFNVLIMKFIACIIAFAIGLDLFFPANIVDILSFSLTVTVASYLIGELIVLRHFGNTAAVMVDFVLTYMSVWVFGNVVLNNYMQIAWGSIISASLIGVAEVYVHRYVLSRDPSKESTRQRGAQFQTNYAYITEFAEDPDLPEKKDPEK